MENIKEKKLEKRNKIIEKYDFIEDSHKRKFYDLSTAIRACQELAKDNKFIPSLELDISLGIDPKYSDQNIRFMSNIKHGLGKNPPRIAVISLNPQDIELANSLKVHLAGGQEIIDDIKKGNINFDLIITTPQSMSLFGSVAKILGTKGLMPNPKSGRITNNIAEVISKVGNQIEVRPDKLGFYRTKIGTSNFSEEQLKENIINLLKDINNNRPKGAKGKLIRSVHLSYTQGPSFHLTLSSLQV